jgi:capsular polysaccharide biosynthesis protein
VSRYGLNRAGWSTRIMRNEEELIARLGSIGFEAIEPEQMSMREQIAAFASASIVVGPSGSGMFNTIFCHPGTKIIDLQSESQWIYSYTGMYASLGLRYGIFVGKAETPDGQPVHRPWQVNIEALMVRLRTFLAN